jgi:predicted  nucleic acid-binding Zn-ribbon protein
MGITRQLYQLQAIELDIESKEKTLTRSFDMLKESKALLDAKDVLSTCKQHFNELKKQQQDIEWEIEDVISKLSSVQELLYSGRITNPKELSSLQQEVEGFKNKRDNWEEKALEVMEQVEATTKKLASFTKQLDEVEKSWRQEQQQLTDMIEKLKHSLSKMEKEKKQALVDIDDETVNYYKRLRQKRGQAVARVEQGICRGCGISLSTAELQRVKGDQIIMCNSCGRILFID